MQELSDEEYEEISPQMYTFDQNTADRANYILDKFEKMLKPLYDEIFRLTNSTFVKELSGNKINMVLHEGEYKILLIADDFFTNSSLDIVENFHLMLSKLGLTPFIHKHGKVEAYDVELLYLLTDYVPLTLSQIEASSLKNELLKRALTIVYAIHGMGYCNQDLHDENFLYDPVNDKVYGVDFTDIVLCDEYHKKLEDTFYLRDLDRRVSFQEIINGVY
jgi:hypothetical protein